MIFFLFFFAALAVTVPFFGADSRDGRDWSLQPSGFLPRIRPPVRSDNVGVEPEECRSTKEDERVDRAAQSGHDSPAYRGRARSAGAAG
ncbi:hypothetical protein GCM10010468_05370 [Actinocorallia longicatena]|uniref:Secreted protein n=1 Tax=Actinocorallia longicatena TaxID=111803 RepID=A0ABP6PXI4_9ACTN